MEFYLEQNQELVHEKPIIEFQGEYRFLSNMWLLDNPIPTEYGDVSTSEHVYMMEKFTDPVIKQQIAKAGTGQKAKIMARNFEKAGVQMVEDWDDARISIMTEAVEVKFILNPDLAEKLVQTGNAHIEEGNNWGDTYWGISPPGSGIGQNHLGRILMKLRDDLKKNSISATIPA